jgi:hypothetical protein
LDFVIGSLLLQAAGGAKPNRPFRSQFGAHRTLWMQHRVAMPGSTFENGPGYCSKIGEQDLCHRSGPDAAPSNPQYAYVLIICICIKLPSRSIRRYGRKNGRVAGMSLAEGGRLT